LPNGPLKVFGALFSARLYIHHPAFFFLRPVQGDPRTSSSPPPASPRHLATIAATTIAITITSTIAAALPPLAGLTATTVATAIAFRAFGEKEKNMETHRWCFVSENTGCVLYVFF
jgi:hypothetical protein